MEPNVTYLPWDKQSGTVRGESCLFREGNRARLLFPVQSIRRVWCPRTGRLFQPGKDYTFTPGGDYLERTEQSAIPLVTEDKLYPPDEKCVYYPAPRCNAISGRVGGGNIWFSARDEYAQAQVEVDYHSDAIDFEPQNDLDQADRLPRFRKLLRGNDTLRVTLLGDSISEGYNASAYIGVPPFQPCYVEQVHRFLRALHPGKLSFHNRAVNGTGTRHGLNVIRDQWKADAPDLLILAYGMNDFASMTAQEFLKNNLELVEHARQVNPEVEFLLVNSMAGNPEWKCTQPGRDEEFSQTLHQFLRTAGEAFALADVRKVWLPMVERKGFYQLTGNGVNHPNDFAHRVYASVLCSVLKGSKETE